MTQCPYCKEEIQPGATICPHCHKKIETPGQKKFKALAGIGLGIIAMSCMCLFLASMMQSQRPADIQTSSFLFTIGMVIAVAGVIAFLVGLIGKGFNK